MIKTIKNIGRKAVLAAALALPAFTVGAQEAELPLAMRAKAEYTGDFQNPGELRQTLGLAMPGSYDGRTAIPGQLYDSFRAVSIQTDSKNSYMLGARILPQKMLKSDESFIPTKSYVYGSFDDKGLARAIANETQFNIKETDTTFSLRGEFYDGQNSLSHVGGLLSQKVGKFTPGFGFDRVTTASGNTDQTLFNLVYEPSQNDWASLIYANQKSPDGIESNRARFVLGHHGPKENFGHRSFFEYDWNNRNEKSVTAHTIVAPFGPSTFTRTANQLLTENTFFWDDSFKLTKTPYTFYTETIPEYDRIMGDNVAENGFNLKGLGFLGDYAYKTNPQGSCAVIDGKIVYVGRLSKNLGQNEAGVSIGAAYERNYGKDVTSLTAGATVRLGKHFSVGGSVKAPMNNPANPGVNVWGEWKF